MLASLTSGEDEQNPTRVNPSRFDEKLTRSKPSNAGAEDTAAIVW
jgi:hypothetical protein